MSQGNQEQIDACEDAYCDVPDRFNPLSPRFQSICFKLSRCSKNLVTICALESIFHGGSFGHVNGVMINVELHDHRFMITDDVCLLSFTWNHCYRIGLLHSFYNPMPINL